MTIKEKVLKELQIGENPRYPFDAFWSELAIDKTLAKVGKRIMTYPNTCLKCKICNRAWKKLKKELGIK